MDVSERLEAVNKFNMIKYANRIVRDKTGLRVKAFKKHTDIYGREWAETIWQYCREIKAGKCRYF